MQELVKVATNADGKQVVSAETYFTLSEYASIYGLKINSSIAYTLGIKCMEESKKAGVEVRTVNDAPYDNIITFQSNMLSMVFEKTFKN
jgi:hypothetical protein